VSRHRFCPTNDRDGFIEKLAQERLEEKQEAEGGRPWSELDPDV
jgi:hypothetical protein